MRIVIGIAVYLCVVAIVLCEQCTTNTDCRSTLCSAGNQVICQHPDGAGIVANGGLCTCGDKQGECVLQSDCFGDKAPSLSCPDNARHCYDGRCICDRFPIGKSDV
ncbi:hypothetical protein DPMN_021318 [Dreissena polymorpha]|uniref:Uncharacterized protein n=1 Tax=Dreissena polymorpha TaxID=45954 RepID=A0A9D4SAX9_DREPO|nr:hypothetical protein DPMN_021318 [Dreissena polymorpha]